MGACARDGGRMGNGVLSRWWWRRVGREVDFLAFGPWCPWYPTGTTRGNLLACGRISCSIGESRSSKMVVPPAHKKTACTWHPGERETSEQVIDMSFCAYCCVSLPATTETCTKYIYIWREQPYSACHGSCAIIAYAECLRPP